jgi:plasmid stability protein
MNHCFTARTVGATWFATELDAAFFQRNGLLDGLRFDGYNKRIKMTSSLISGGRKMKAITVRNIDPELARALKSESRKRSKSMNAIILEYIRASLIPGKRLKKPVNTNLDHLAGTWTLEDEKEFSEAIAPFEAIDTELWK